jgi:hypothetical protein
MSRSKSQHVGINPRMRYAHLVVRAAAEFFRQIFRQPDHVVTVVKLRNQGTEIAREIFRVFPVLDKKGAQLAHGDRAIRARYEKWITQYALRQIGACRLQL